MSAFTGPEEVFAYPKVERKLWDLAHERGPLAVLALTGFLAAFPATS